MQVYWLVVAVILAAGLGVTTLRFLRKAAVSRKAAGDSSWADDFSMDKYRPMERLLCSEDFAFLRTQPGYDSSLEGALRKSRLRVFRSYLKSVRRDFERLYFAAKEAALHSESDQMELIQAIVRQRVVFYGALFLVEVRLGGYALGLTTVDVRPMLGIMEGMRDAARALQPMAQAA